MADRSADPLVSSVLVPIDAASPDDRAIPFAEHLARRLGAPLTIMTVVADMRTQGAESRAAMAALLSEVPVARELLVQADAVEESIAEAAHDAVVCMATNARRSAPERVTDSVAERVIAAATCPVVLVGPQAAAHPPVDRVVVGIDPTHDQETLHRWAAVLADLLEVPIEAVHVGSPLDGPTTVTHVPPERGTAVADQLLAETGGSLLALGSHGRLGLERLLEGSVSGEVLRLSRRPVLVVGPRAEPPRSSPAPR